MHWNLDYHYIEDSSGGGGGGGGGGGTIYSSDRRICMRLTLPMKQICLYQPS